MKVGTIRAGLAALMWLLASAALPAAQAQAQVTCPSAANDETLNIVTTGGVTTCTNIGTAAATEGIEIRNNLVKDVDTTIEWSFRFGVSLRRITTGGNEQPTAVGCVGQCFNVTTPGRSIDEDRPDASSSGLVYDWGYGTGATTMVFCGAGLSSAVESCTVSFQFSDGTTGAFTVATSSTVIPSFSLGGTVALPPEITSVTPSPAAVGDTVVILGTRLDTVTRVVAAGNGNTSFQIISSTEIRFVPAEFSYTTSSLQVVSPTGVGTSNLIIAPARVAITTTSLPSGTVGSSYSSAISVVGGTNSGVSAESTVTYGYAATGLPTGLSINGSGVISGQPTQAGTFSVTVTVSDPGRSFDNGNGLIWPPTSTSKTFTLTIASSVTVTTSTLPGGTVGAPYTAPLAASGSTAPYTFAATGLPAGLAVSGASITGTPTQAGTFTVAITATDSTTPTPIASLATQLSLAIGAGGKLGQTITFTQPTGVVFKAGATVALKATASSGLAVAFASTTPAACTVAGTTATIVKAGTCTVKASQAGNATYAAAADVSVSFAIATTPSLSATAVVTPDKFSRPGETLTFVITLANTGGTTATGIRMSEPRLANLACAATTLAAGAKLNCQGTTLTTTADLTAGSISITPQLTYTYAEATP